jgi:hypothetical protein
MPDGASAFARPGSVAPHHHGDQMRRLDRSMPCSTAWRSVGVGALKAADWKRLGLQVARSAAPLQPREIELLADFLFAGRREVR